ncbi:hypothetical protein CY35_02G103200 [Sphagnum magellanicum]|nr:hypothetical protein CY35_02G103200 [Sphagnum magellanicum]
MAKDSKHKVVGNIRDAVPGGRESFLKVEILSRPPLLSQAGPVSTTLALPIPPSDNHGQCIVPVSVGRYGVPAFLRNTDNDSHSSPKCRSPPPEEESQILREWNKHNALEIEERRKESNDQQYRILEEAAIQREAFYTERAAQIRVTKYTNREKEEQCYREMETRIKEGTESNIWKTVSSLTDLDNEFPSTSTMNSRSATPQNVITAAVDVMSESRRPKSPAEVIAMSLSDAKKASAFSPRKRTADVSRMKEILLKLKQQRFAPRTV